MWKLDKIFSLRPKLPYTQYSQSPEIKTWTVCAR